MGAPALLSVCREPFPYSSNLTNGVHPIVAAKGMSHCCRSVLWRLPDVFEVDGCPIWLPARPLQFSDYSARRFASPPGGAAHGHLCRLPGLRKRIPLRLARNEDRGIADERTQALPGYERGRVKTRCPAAHFRDGLWPKMNIPPWPLPSSCSIVFFLFLDQPQACPDLFGIMSLA